MATPAAEVASLAFTSICLRARCFAVKARCAGCAVFLSFQSGRVGEGTCRANKLSAEACIFRAVASKWTLDGCRSVVLTVVTRRAVLRYRT